MSSREENDATRGEGVLDWSSATVENGRLTVAFAERMPKEWSRRFASVVALLHRQGSSSGDIKVTRARVRVGGVTPGAEEDVRHLLDAAALQTAAAASGPGDVDDRGRSEEDEAMTAAFRSFADQ